MFSRKRRKVRKEAQIKNTIGIRTPPSVVLAHLTFDGYARPCYIWYI